MRLLLALPGLGTSNQSSISGSSKRPAPLFALQEAKPITVGAGQAYATISEALQNTPSGGTVEVYGGQYRERLVISQPVSIIAAPGAAVEIVWATSEPYQATIECSGVQEPGAVLVRGLRVRHSSPSIANNYAVKLSVSAQLLLLLPVALRQLACVRVVAAALVLSLHLALAEVPVAAVCRLHTPLTADPQPLILPARHSRQDCGAVVMDCDISSTTGSGVGIEGGAPRLQRCSVHHCARHGGWPTLACLKQQT